MQIPAVKVINTPTGVNQVHAIVLVRIIRLIIMMLIIKAGTASFSVESLTINPRIKVPSKPP